MALYKFWLKYPTNSSLSYLNEKSLNDKRYNNVEIVYAPTAPLLPVILIPSLSRFSTLSSL